MAGTFTPSAPAVPKFVSLPVYPTLMSGPTTWMLCWLELSSSENVYGPLLRYVTCVPLSRIGSCRPSIVPFRVGLV